MKLSLNTNIGSLRAQNQLLKASEKLQTSFERLSSGLRINRASEDPVEAVNLMESHYLTNYLWSLDFSSDVATMEV